MYKIFMRFCTKTEGMKGFVQGPAPQGPFMINDLGRLCDDTIQDGRDIAKGAFETNRMENEDKMLSVSICEPQKSNVDLSKATWHSAHNQDTMSRVGPRGTPPAPLPIPDPTRPDIMNVSTESLIEYEAKQDAEYVRNKLNGMLSASSAGDVDVDGEICVEPGTGSPKLRCKAGDDSGEQPDELSNQGQKQSVNGIVLPKLPKFESKYILAS